MNNTSNSIIFRMWYIIFRFIQKYVIFILVKRCNKKITKNFISYNKYLFKKQHIYEIFENPDTPSTPRMNSYIAKSLTNKGFYVKYHYLSIAYYLSHQDLSYRITDIKECFRRFTFFMAIHACSHRFGPSSPGQGMPEPCIFSFSSLTYKSMMTKCVGQRYQSSLM